MNLENEVLVLTARISNHTCLLGSSPEEKATTMLLYLKDCQDKGCSTFYSYRTCLQIKELIQANHSLALLSFMSFIRTIAQNC